MTMPFMWELRLLRPRVIRCLSSLPIREMRQAYIMTRTAIMSYHPFLFCGDLLAALRAYRGRSYAIPYYRRYCLFWHIIHTRSWRDDSLLIKKKNVNTSGCSYVSYRCFTFSETIHPGWSGPSFYTGSGREKRYLLRYLSPPFFISFWVI